MNWNHEQRQEFYTDTPRYDGYTGAPEQPSQSYEQKEGQQQQTFSQQERQPQGYAQVDNGQRPVPPMSGSELSAVLSYGLFWFSGLLFVLLGGQNRFVRFHALQSLLFFGAVNVINVGLMLIMTSWRFYYYNRWMVMLAFLFFLVMNATAFVTWIVAMIQAGRGAYFKLPFVGDFVARHINRSVSLK